MDKKRITIAFLIVLTNTIGATAILPMLPLYVEKQFQATPLQATLVIAAFYAAQFVAAPWLGKLSDRWGRWPILIISQIGTIASYLLFVFAAQLGTGLEGIGFTFGIGGGLAVIYVARILDGLTGGNISVAEAYASDISNEKSRTQALGLIGGANGLGHILGPGLAVLLSGLSLIAPIVGAAILSGVTLLLTMILLDETVIPEKQAAHKSAGVGPSMSQLLLRRSVWLVLSTALVIGLYIAVLFSTFSLYAERVLFPNQPAEEVVQNAGLMIMGVGLVAAMSQIILIKPLVRRWGEQVLVVFGSTLLLVSAIGLGSAPSVTAAVLSILTFALGFALSWPSLQAIMTRFGSTETTGHLLGLFQSAFSLALILAPVGAGFVPESRGPRAVYYSGAVLMGLATLLGLIIFHLSFSDSDEGQIKVETTAEPQGFLHRLHH